MGIFIGPVARGVFVFDFNIAKEFVFNDIYLGKYGSDYARNMRGYNGTRVGIIQTEGHTWKTNRRFSLSTLRGELGYISISVHGKWENNNLLKFLEFGFGKSSLEAIISEEAKEIIDNIASSSHGQDFLVDQTFNISVFNVLWRIVSGKRYQVGTNIATFFQN